MEFKELPEFFISRDILCHFEKLPYHWQRNCDVKDMQSDAVFMSLGSIVFYPSFFHLTLVAG